MISDPRTTPDSRAGPHPVRRHGRGRRLRRSVQLFRTNGLLWSLAVCSLVVPLIDRLLPGPRYQWRPGPAPEAAHERTRAMKRVRRRPSSCLARRRACRAVRAWPSAASTSPRPTPSSSTARRRWCWSATTTRPCSPWPTTTRASRRSSRSSCRCRPCSSKGQIHVADRALIEHLDAYSAPRLVEYFDEDPCAPRPTTDGAH